MPRLKSKRSPPTRGGDIDLLLRAKAHDSLEFIQGVFEVIADTPLHTYQVLTKRSLRLRRLASRLPLPPNLWMGVSVEDVSVASRIEHLRQVPAAVRFLSCEPMLDPLDDIDLTGIGWVIAGGESGPNYRPMHLEWARSLRDACQKAGCPSSSSNGVAGHPKQETVMTIRPVLELHCRRRAVGIPGSSVQPGGTTRMVGSDDVEHRGYPG